MSRFWGGVNVDLILICFVLNPHMALLADTRQRFAVSNQLSLHFHERATS